MQCLVAEPKVKDVTMTLKRVLKKPGVNVIGSCTHGNRLSGSTKEGTGEISGPPGRLSDSVSLRSMVPHL